MYTTTTAIKGAGDQLLVLLVLLLHYNKRTPVWTPLPCLTE